MRRDLLLVALVEAVVFVFLYWPLVTLTNGTYDELVKSDSVANTRITQAASVTVRGTAVPMENDPLRLVVAGTDKSSVSDRVAVLLADSSAKQTYFSSNVDLLIAYVTGLLGLSVLLVGRIAGYTRRWKRADEGPAQSRL